MNVSSFLMGLGIFSGCPTTNCTLTVFPFLGSLQGYHCPLSLLRSLLGSSMYSLR